MDADDVDLRRETERSGGGDDDDDLVLANFLEEEILSAEDQNQQQEGEETGKRCEGHPGTSKRPRCSIGEEDDGDVPPVRRLISKGPKRIIETGAFSRIPQDLFHNILKFLSSEDLISCSLVCRCMNFAASDESLWRRLYCMRWGLASPAGKLHTCPWKKLYIQRDQEDMIEFIRHTPSEFKEYYIQMQAAKRSQAPLPSQVNDDHIILDKTIADQVSIWKRIRGLTDEVILGHACSGNTCTYFQIGDVFLCEKTGHVHVCDDTCREAVLDPSSGNLVCTISGHCFDRLLSPDEESDAEQQNGLTDDVEPFMGSGRFARAYLLGYNCADEKELKAALRFC